MNKVITPNQERVLVIGGPANGQSHYIDAGSDRLEVVSPLSEGGLFGEAGKPFKFVYKVRKLRIPDPVTGNEAVFRIATQEDAPLEEAFNALFFMYHQSQVGGSTTMPAELAKRLWRHQ